MIKTRVIDQNLEKIGENKVGPLKIPVKIYKLLAIQLKGTNGKEDTHKQYCESKRRPPVGPVDVEQ